MRTIHTVHYVYLMRVNRPLWSFSFLSFELYVFSFLSCSSNYACIFSFLSCSRHYTCVSLFPFISFQRQTAQENHLLGHSYITRPSLFWPFTAIELSSPPTHDDQWFRKYPIINGKCIRNRRSLLDESLGIHENGSERGLLESPGSTNFSF